MLRLRSLGLVVGLSGCAAVAAEVGTVAFGQALSNATKVVQRTLAATPKAASTNHPIPMPAIPKPLAAEPAPMPIPVRPTPTAAPYAEPASAGSFVDMEIDPRYTIRRDFGNGVGYQSGFTYFEAFLPVWQTPGESIAFLNARVINFDDTSYWETQIGGGARCIVDGSVLGINGFYDGRNTNVSYYHQLGFGLELLREKWEFRSNFYFPIGNTRNVAADTGFINPRFLGTNIALDRQIAYETAMQGLNVEAGRQLPNCCHCDSLRTYAYLGYYHYQASGVPSIDGFRARIESWYDENVSMNLAIQNDRVFDTTITGGLSLHFGGVPRGARKVDPLAAKLGSRVVRDPNIVLQSSKESKTELATDPTTGKPIEVRHVNSTVPAGGNGSYENPYRTLSTLQTNSAVNQILFAHAGSTFNNQTITLKNGQRFLGEGIDHSFTATQGTFLLPRATPNTLAPRFTGTGLNTIRVANNTEVSGMNITRTGNAITGTNVTNVLIDRNRIVSPTLFLGNGLSPITLTSTGGTRNWTIEGNTLNSGVILNGANSNLIVAVRNNTFQTGGNLRINQALGTSRFQVANNTFAGGIIPFNYILAGGTSTMQFANNTRAGGGIFAISPTLSTLNLENTLPSNTPAPTITNIGSTVNTVPVGTAGFGNP